MRRQTQFRIVLVLLGCVVALALAGIGIYLKLLPNPFPRRHRAIVATGEQRRVLVLGDSFLDWWPIEECLNRALAAWSEEHNIALRNTGHGGWGPREYLERIQTVGPQFKPNLVLLFYYAGNDLTDEMYRPLDEAPRSSGTAELLPAPRPRPFNPLDWLCTSAHAAEAKKPSEADFDWERFRKQGIDPQMIEFAKNRLRDPKIAPDQVNPYVLSTATFSQDYIVDNILAEGLKAPAAIERVQGMLGKVIETARSLHADILITVIPATVQVSRSHFDFYRKCTFHLDDRLLTSRRPQEFIREVCRKYEVPMLDLLPAFKAAENRDDLYWPNDDHLSAAGNTLAMQTLRREFLDDWEAHTR